MQSIVGTFLYQARALNYLMLPTLNEISCIQAKHTIYTKDECQQLIDYAAICPNVCVRYHASNMILTVDSNVACLVLPQAKSRITGYFQLNDNP